MHVTTRCDAVGEVSLILSGRLDLHAHVEFTAAWESALERPGLNGMVIDFAGVDYVDSSGLGMLLILHRATSARRIAVTLRACRPHFSQVLRASSFTRLFRVTEADTATIRME